MSWLLTTKVRSSSRAGVSERFEALASFDVKTQGGLVQKDQRSAAGQCAYDASLLLHALRELPHLSVALLIQREELEDIEILSILTRPNTMEG